MPRLLFSLLAKADIRDIALYIARDNVPASKRWVLAIKNKCRLLAKYPEMGENRSDLGAGIRLSSYQNYGIYFRRTDRGVEIARIIRGDRNVTSL
ncbi:type II toxin-antitoxin system RelE/ParE family toxin [Bremerella sp. JC770]|uniref:type II toxin-antitoxin system RelE/ParE family toxin n=1 Tax=Bremerella sp. JC770 TaxID=3232137 RepID=UPI00345B0F44